MGREKKLTKCERQVVFKTCTAVFSLILRILIAGHCTMMIWTYGRLLWSSKPEPGGYFGFAKAEYFVELVQKPAWRANTSFTVFYLFIVIVISIQDQVQAFINLFHCDENKKVEKCAKNRYFRNTTKGFQTMLSFFTSFTTVILVVYSVAATLFQMSRMAKMDGFDGDFISKGFFCIAACLLVVMPVLSHANLEIQLVDACTNGRTYKRGCLKSLRNGFTGASEWLSQHFREYNATMEFVEVFIQVISMISVSWLPIHEGILLIWAGAICLNCLAAAYSFGTKPQLAVFKFNLYIDVIIDLVYTIVIPFLLRAVSLDLPVCNGQTNQESLHRNGVDLRDNMCQAVGKQMFLSSVIVDPVGIFQQIVPFYLMLSRVRMGEKIFLAKKIWRSAARRSNMVRHASDSRSVRTNAIVPLGAINNGKAASQSEGKQPLKDQRITQLQRPTAFLSKVLDANKIDETPKSAQSQPKTRTQTDKWSVTKLESISDTDDTNPEEGQQQQQQKQQHEKKKRRLQNHSSTSEVSIQKILMLATLSSYMAEDVPAQKHALQAAAAKSFASARTSSSRTNDGDADPSSVSKVGKAKKKLSTKNLGTVARILVAIMFTIIGVGVLTLTVYQIRRPKCGAISDKWRHCIYHASPLLTDSECPCVIYSDTCGAQLERVPRHPADRFACHRPHTAQQWRETSATTVIHGGRVFVPGWKRTCDSNSDCNTFSYCTNQRVCEFCVGCQYLQNSISFAQRCDLWCGQKFDNMPLSKVDFWAFVSTDAFTPNKETAGLGEWCKQDMLLIPSNSYEAYAQANIIEPYVSATRRCEAGLYCAPSSSASVEVLGLLGNPDGDHAFRCEKCSRCESLFDRCPECGGEEDVTSFVGCFQPLGSLSGQVVIVRYEGMPQCSAVARARGARYFAVRNVAVGGTEKECLVFPSQVSVTSSVDLVAVPSALCSVLKSVLVGGGQSTSLVTLYTRDEQCDALAQELCASAHRQGCVAGSGSMQCGPCLSGFIPDTSQQSSTCLYKLPFAATWTNAAGLNCKLAELRVAVHGALRGVAGRSTLFIQELNIYPGGGVRGVGGDGSGDVNIIASEASIASITRYFNSGSKLNMLGLGSLSLAKNPRINTPTTSSKPTTRPYTGAPDNNTCLRRKRGWADGHSCDRLSAWCDDAVLGQDLRECCPFSCATSVFGLGQAHSNNSTQQCTKEKNAATTKAKRCPQNPSGELMGFDFPPGTCDSALANPILVGMARKIRVELSCWMLERHFLWDCTGCNCTQIPTAKLPKASSRTSVTTPPPHPQLIPPPPPLAQSHAATDQRSFGELIHDLHISAKSTLIIFKMKNCHNSTGGLLESDTREPLFDRLNYIAVQHSGADLPLEQVLRISRGSLLLVDLSGTAAHSLTIPNNIREQAPSLQHLYLSQARLETVPPELSEMKHLQVLDLSNNRLRDVEALVSASEEPLPQLQKLYLRSNDLRRLPDRIGSLRSLYHLDVSNNTRLSHLPSDLGSNEKLQHLLVSCCNMTRLPAALGSSRLVQLDAKDNMLTSIPASLASVGSLSGLLSLSNNAIEQLPTNIGSLSKLQGLGLDNNPRLEVVPRSLASLSRLQFFSCNHCRALRECEACLPPNLGYLRVGSASEFDMLKAMGDPLRFRHTLRYFIAGDTKLSQLPPSFGSLTNLVRIMVPNHCRHSNRSLTTLPASLGSLTKLQELSVAGQNIRALPPSIFRLTELAELDVSHCPLATVPRSLWARRPPLRMLRIFGCEALAATVVTANALGPNLPGHPARPSFHFLSMSPSSMQLSLPRRVKRATLLVCNTQAWSKRTCDECGERAPAVVDHHMLADCDLIDAKDTVPVQHALLGSKSTEGICRSPFAWQSSTQKCDRPHHCRPVQVVPSDISTCRLQVPPPMLTPGVLLPLANCDILMQYLGYGCGILEEYFGMDCSGCECPAMPFEEAPLFTGALCRGWEEL